VVWGLAWAASTVLPIHYSSNEPVLEFPIDLLFYNFLMPLAVKFFKPRDGLHAMYTWWFRKCARYLRITWFLFGERRIDEEGIIQLPDGSPYEALPWWRRQLLEYDDTTLQVGPKTWHDALEGGLAKPTEVIESADMAELNDKKRKLVESQQLAPDGKFVRAPASDQVRIPKGQRVFLDVTEQNQRDGGKDDRLADIYDGDKYQFVYIPPNFRLRVFLFILFIWLFAAATGVGITIVPLVFGRRMFKLLIPAHIRTNDIYAFSIGIYILGSLLYLACHARSVATKVKGFLHRAFRNLPADNITSRVWTSLLRVAKLAYCYAVLIVFFPLVTALAVELYLLVPLHTYISPHEPAGHTIRIIQTWTLGLLYVKLVGRTITSWYGGTRLAAAVRAILRRGWLDPDTAVLTRAFFIPGVVATAVIFGLPLASANMLISYYESKSHTWGGSGLTQTEVTLIYRLVFPAMAFAAGLLWCLWGVVDVLRSWKVRIRDEAYLIGERLHNFGASASPKAKTAWRGGTRL
jgi:E3 ubiquitin-protein ligase MARCH6